MNRSSFVFLKWVQRMSSKRAVIATTTAATGGSLLWATTTANDDVNDSSLFKNKKNYLWNVDSKMTHCQAQAQDDDDDFLKDMPEKDEETHCVICQMNRQGPCRPFWRRFEYCQKKISTTLDANKETTDTSNKDEKKEWNERMQQCDKYFLPWMSCWHSFINLYTLLNYTFYQTTFLDPLEKALRTSLYQQYYSTNQQQQTTNDDHKGHPKQWENPTVDTTKIIDFIQQYIQEYMHQQRLKRDQSDDNDDNNLMLHQFQLLQEFIDWVPQQSNHDDLEHFQHLPPKPFFHDNLDLQTVQDDFMLLDVYVQVEMTTQMTTKEEQEKVPLEIVYARDQHGRLLGYASYDSLAKDQQKEESNNNLGTLTIHVQPFETTRFKLYKLYRTQQEQAPNNNNNDDASDKDNKSNESQQQEVVDDEQQIFEFYESDWFEVLKPNLQQAIQKEQHKDHDGKE